MLDNIQENVIIKADYNWQKESLTNVIKNSVKYLDF